MGYDGNGQAAYKDPDGGQYNSGTHYFDWSINESEFAMGTTKYVP